MKYLRKFNEDIDTNFHEELKDFCESNLAYLLDDGTTKVQVEYRPTLTIDYSRVPADTDIYQVRIVLEDTKRWEEIKDHMIPFLTMLNNKYQIYEYTGIKRRTKTDVFIFTAPYQDHSHNIEFRIKDVITDRVNLSFAAIREFRLVVAGYKIKPKGIISRMKSFLRK